MPKFRLILIIAGLIILAALIILCLRAWLLPTQETASPPTSSAAPISATPGADVWSGLLRLEAGAAFLQTQGKEYQLNIPGAAAAEILKNKGYQNNDMVNIMGRLNTAGQIQVSGLNKLAP